MITLEDVSTFLIDLLIGSISSIISKTAMAPIERVKLLLQLQDASKQIIENIRYKGIVDCFTRIYHEQGFLSFWRGNWANVLRYFPTQAFNFAFNDMFKIFFVGDTDKKTQFWFFFAGNVASGSAAGACTQCIVHPLDFTRTRLATDVGTDKTDREFQGMCHCISTICRSDGISGLYRGFIVSLIGIVIYRGAYFGLYDTAVAMLPEEQDRNIKILISLVIAPTTTSLSNFISYPFDTVRRRMMMQSGESTDETHSKTWLHCAYHIYNSEGLLGFYKGGYMNILCALGNSLVLVMYHVLKNLVVS